MGRVCSLRTEEITNIKLQVCEFEPHIIRFCVQGISLFV